MADIELLPHWYSQARRQRRLMIIQYICTAALLSVLTVVGYLRRHTVWETQNQVSLLETNLMQSRHQLNELAAAKKQMGLLQARQRIYQSLGTQIEPDRVLATLGRVMPTEIGLTAFDLSIENQQVALSSVERVTDRRLKVHLTGVAPSDSAVGQMIERLDKVPAFANVQLTYVKGKSDTCREFDLGFGISINRIPAASQGDANRSGSGTFPTAGAR